jgi:hypothetical protein
VKRGPAPQRLPGGLAATTLALAAMVAPAGGCSFVFVSGPPPLHEKLSYFSCTSNVVWPVIDTVFAASMAGIFVDAATRSAAEEVLEGDSSEDMTMSAIFGGVALASAVFGYVRTHECRVALEQLNARPQPPPAPSPGYGYPPPGAYPPPPGYGPPPGYPPAAYPPVPYDPWNPPAPAPPAQPAPAPPPPGEPAPPAAPAPAPPPSYPAPPPAARLVPRLRIELAPVISRLGAPAAYRMLAATPLRLRARY